VMNVSARVCQDAAHIMHTHTRCGVMNKIIGEQLVFSLTDQLDLVAKFEEVSDEEEEVNHFDCDVNGDDVCGD